MDEKIFSYKGKLYPDYIRRGKAHEFVEPYAKFFCVGKGYDIGGEVGGNGHLANAIPINTNINDEYSAFNLPKYEVDFIHSSHCLEHLNNYIKALEHWKTRLKLDGCLFLYLPHPDMEYWQPQNCRKHLHLFHPKHIKDVLNELGFKNIIQSERDLYWSFLTVAFKGKP